MDTKLPPITLSSLDYERLEDLIEPLSSKDFPAISLLRRELDRADIKDPNDMPDNIVTMNSTVSFQMAASAETMTLSLVYPKDVKKDGICVSILAPVGAALLGLTVGQSLPWLLPDGQKQSLTIMDIHYQPEAAGEWYR